MSSAPLAPLAIDLFCGLGGWTEGLLAEGFTVVGFDVEQHVYGDQRYPAQLVLQDVCTLHGSQFRDATIIVASSPCQEFSYRAMPWKRAKALGPPELGMHLFSQARRIQLEACEAAGRYIPMIQENVRGAQKYVGKAQWHYGSYYLWGDVPALMPMVSRAVKIGGTSVVDAQGNRRIAAEWRSKAGQTVEGMKNSGGSWFNVAHNTTSGHGKNPVHDAVKGASGGWFNDAKRKGGGATGYLSQSGSKSPARKAASAKIAKIPFPLSRWIAQTYYPREDVA